MNEMYKKIEALCSARGINITQMCKEAGVSRAPLTELKKGRTAILSATNSDKIAKYFNVSVGYLLGTEAAETEKPTADDGLSINQKELMEFIRTLSDDDAAMILRVSKSIFRNG